VDDKWREDKLAFVIIMKMPVFWPMARELFLLDRNLNSYIMAFLLVFLCAMLLRHLVAFWNSVFAAVLLWHIVAFGHIDVMTRFMRDLLTFLFVIVAWFAFFGVSG